MKQTFYEPDKSEKKAIGVRDNVPLTSPRNSGPVEYVTNTLLSKGLFIRPPYVTIAKEVDFVRKQDFLTGFLGERRPLLTPMRTVDRRELVNEEKH